MKIGILTFHWGANHGAILQAYASQRYLEQCGHTVSVIDYLPAGYELTLKNALRPSRPATMLQRLKTYRKERALAPFRQNLHLTDHYNRNQALIDAPPAVDVLLAGSDQILNPAFLRVGEGGLTPVYFLNFGAPGCKKMTLSASFGCSSYPEDVAPTAAEHLRQMDAISVREQSGLDILRQFGLNGTLTADPTSLLESEDYRSLCANIATKPVAVSRCMLRKQNGQTRKLVRTAAKAFGGGKAADIENLGMEQWLAAIRDSQLVITNSFHCIMLCLKLHTPFAALYESGIYASMNDRLSTLLRFFGLEDRAVTTEEEARALNSRPGINWSDVDEKMGAYTATLKTFLADQLS